MRASRTLWLCGLFSASVALYPAPSLAAEVCFILNLYDAQLFPAEKSAAISLTALSPERGVETESANNIQTLNRDFVEALKEALLDSKYFTSVTTASAGDASRGAYLVEAGVLGATQRNYAGRIWGGGASMRIGGSLLGPAPATGPRPLIGRWECAGANAGGFLGGGVLAGAGSNERAARNNIKNIADALTVRLADKDLKKDLAKQATEAAKEASEKPSRGSTETDKRKWREKSDWDKGDFRDEIASFAVSSETKRQRGVDGLWLTDGVYQTHQKFLPMLDLSRALFRPCFLGGCKDDEEIARGTVLDLEPLERFKGKNVYVISLTFNTALTDGPAVWRGEELRRATVLARADQPNASVAPIEFLDDPRALYPVGLLRFHVAAVPTRDWRAPLSTPSSPRFRSRCPTARRS